MSFAYLAGLGRLYSLAGAPGGAPLRQATTPTVPLPTVTEVAAATTTAGATVVPAAATTPTVPPAPLPTLAPIPPPPPPSPFSADYFTAAAQPGLGLLSGLFVLASLVLLGAGAYYYFMARTPWRRAHRLHYNLAGFWGMTGMILGGLGVLFTLLRIFNVDGLNQRLWLYLITLAILGFGVYALYYFRFRYPAALAEFQSKYRPARTAARGASPRPQAQRPGTASAPPERTPGSAGNPRGTSARGERRRAKKR